MSKGSGLEVKNWVIFQSDQFSNSVHCAAAEMLVLALSRKKKESIM